NLSGSVFRGPATFRGMEIRGPFRMSGARFPAKTDPLLAVVATTVVRLGSAAAQGPFLAAAEIKAAPIEAQVDCRSLRAGHLVDVSKCVFSKTRPATFDFSQIATVFYMDEVDVRSAIYCSQMRVGGDGYFTEVRLFGPGSLQDTRVGGN